MLFHYLKNKEINGSVKYIEFNKNIVKAIYKIGLPAAIMQALLACMMFIVLLIFKMIPDKSTIALMTNSFGIYYKIMQIALFACFGLSNTLITLISFNYGMKEINKVKETIKYGLIYSISLALIITIIFEAFASILANLFGLSLEEISTDGIIKDDIINTCKVALQISSIGYLLMGLSVGIQRILQEFRNVYKLIIISLCRLIIFFVPFAIIFCLDPNVSKTFWWTFHIAEALTSVIAVLLLINSLKKLNYN